MFFLFCRMCTMCAEINDLIPLLLLLHYKVKVVHHVLGCIYFFNTGTSLCLRWQPATWNIFVFGTKALFWCHILWVKNGRGKKREMGTIQKKKKKVIDIFVYCINVCLVGGIYVYLFVKINDWLYYSWPKITNLKQVEQIYVLRARMIAMCTFLFLYNVNMSISKLTFWDAVGF